MKKIFIILIVFVFCYTFNVKALDKSVFTVNSVSGTPGSEVVVSINLNNTSKYNSVGMFIPLNTLMVEYVSCEINGFSKASMKDCGLNPKNEVTFYAFTINNNLFNESGNILDIKLKIKDNIDQDIPMTMSVNSFSKSTTENLEYDIVDGIIKINGKVEEKTINSKDSLGKEVDEDVVWSSSNDDVAKVDDEGNVSFKDIGNTTIVAKNKNGKTVYEKSYQVNKKKSKSYSKYFIIAGIIVGVLAIIGVIILFIKKKRTR